MELSPILSKEEWRRAHEGLPPKEKEATRARDGLAPGYPRTTPCEWWRSHDAYGVQR